jgi:hypothetical protein
MLYPAELGARAKTSEIEGEPPLVKARDVSELPGRVRHG